MIERMFTVVKESFALKLVLAIIGFTTFYEAAAWGYVSLRTIIVFTAWVFVTALMAGMDRPDER